jgi:hypothetical protein
MNFTPRARQAWINASYFHDHSEEQVLREVADRVSKAKKEGNKPLLLLDLDSTLYEVGWRTLFILKEWTHSAASSEFGRVRERLDGVELRHVGYSIKDTFSALGLSPSDPEVLGARDSAKTFWAERFFTSEYLAHDRPYEGAAGFVRKLHEIGAELIYLTGRDEPGMGEGTRTNLVRDGFPWNTERTHLLLKPDFEQDDLLHKKNAADYVRRQGKLVASFENEPLNLVALYEIFPDAMHVFVETICSDREANPCKDLYRIRSFKY